MLELIKSIWRKEPRINLAKWLSECWSNCSFDFIFSLLWNRFCIVFPPLLKRSSTVAVPLETSHFKKNFFSFAWFRFGLKWQFFWSGWKITAWFLTCCRTGNLNYGTHVIEICLLPSGISFCFVLGLVWSFYLFCWF